MAEKFELHEFEELRNPPGRVDRANAAVSWPPQSSTLVASRWLRESSGKRRAFELCYEDILKPGFCRIVADVGGGLSHVTETLLKMGNYILVDPLHHVSAAEAGALNCYVESFSLHKIDWFDFGFEESELVIANDIFPNVDFRLGAFLDRVLLSDARELRLVLTVFYEQKFMEVQRVDSGELLIVIPLPIEVVCSELDTFCRGSDFRDILRRPRSNSDWDNGRFAFFMKFVRP